MPKLTSLLFILVILFNSCKKDNDMMVTGTVKIPGGCFVDSWVVAIDNPDPGIHSFLQSNPAPFSTLYNCSNAVFISLPSNLAVAEKRIRFRYGSTQISCLSSTGSPNHITVKTLAGL